MNENTAPAGELTDKQIGEIYDEPCDWALPHMITFARAIIAADRALRASPAWQTIETAPITRRKEEKQWVLVYCIPGEFRPPSEAPVQFVAYRMESLLGDGPYWTLQDSVLDVCVYQPTHWMPLGATLKDAAMTKEAK